MQTIVPPTTTSDVDFRLTMIRRYIQRTVRAVAPGREGLDVFRVCVIQIRSIGIKCRATVRADTAVNAVLRALQIRLCMMVTVIRTGTRRATGQAHNILDNAAAPGDPVPEGVLVRIIHGPGCRDHGEADDKRQENCYNSLREHTTHHPAEEYEQTRGKE